MLRIENIEKLKGQHLGGWEVLESTSSGPVSYLKTYHYCITFKRGDKAAALLIDRNENRLTQQYHLYVCWENFDNTIYETALSKESIGKKDAFFGWLVDIINDEYNKRK
jgi:hypothetical protein